MGNPTLRGVVVASEIRGGVVQALEEAALRVFRGLDVASCPADACLVASGRRLSGRLSAPCAEGAGRGRHGAGRQEVGLLNGASGALAGAGVGSGGAPVGHCRTAARSRLGCVAVSWMDQLAAGKGAAWSCFAHRRGDSDPIDVEAVKGVRVVGLGVAGSSFHAEAGRATASGPQGCALGKALCSPPARRWRGGAAAAAAGWWCAESRGRGALGLAAHRRLAKSRGGEREGWCCQPAPGT